MQLLTFHYKQKQAIDDFYRNFIWVIYIIAARIHHIHLYTENTIIANQNNNKLFW